MKNTKTKSEKYIDTEVNDYVKIRLYKGDNEKAPFYGTLTIKDAFAIRFNVVEKNDGDLFISYPSYIMKTGKYVNQAYCFDKSLRADIESAVEEMIEKL